LKTTVTINHEELHASDGVTSERYIQWGDKDLLEMQFYVDSMYHGWRLDHFIGARLRRLSRTRIQVMLARQLRLGGTEYKAARRVRFGEVYALRRVAPDEGDIPLYFTIEYEDEYLAVVTKPSGLPVHETARFRTKTLRAMLAKQSPQWRMAHRLDRETSGLIIVGKEIAVERKMKELFAKREVRKKYLAIIHGQFPRACEYNDSIGPDPDSQINLKQRVYTTKEVHEETDLGVALPARTFVEPLVASSKYSLVQVKPESGRQHQIRVHLSAAGFPIVGDKLYGSDPSLLLQYINDGMNESMHKTLGMNRHALHAESLRFSHPVTQQVIEVSSPVPADMQQFIDRHINSV